MAAPPPPPPPPPAPGPIAKPNTNKLLESIRQGTGLKKVPDSAKNDRSTVIANVKPGGNASAMPLPSGVKSGGPPMSIADALKARAESKAKGGSAAPLVPTPKRSDIPAPNQNVGANTNIPKPPDQTSKPLLSTSFPPPPPPMSSSANSKPPAPPPGNQNRPLAPVSLGHNEKPLAPPPMSFGNANRPMAPVSLGYNDKPLAPPPMSFGNVDKPPAPPPMSFGNANRPMAPMSLGHNDKPLAPPPMSFGNVDKPPAPPPMSMSNSNRPFAPPPMQPTNKPLAPPPMQMNMLNIAPPPPPPTDLKPLAPPVFHSKKPPAHEITQPAMVYPSINRMGAIPNVMNGSSKNTPPHCAPPPPPPLSSMPTKSIPSSLPGKPAPIRPPQISQEVAPGPSRTERGVFDSRFTFLDEKDFPDPNSVTKRTKGVV